MQRDYLEGATMSATPKLTKKQKKSLAFRELKTSKRQHQTDQKHKNEHTGMGDDAYFTLEGQDICDLDGGQVEVEGDAHEKDGAPVGYEEGNEVKRKKSKVSRQSKGEAEKEDVPVFVAILKGKKRKREIEGEEEVEVEEVGNGRAKKSSTGKEPDNEKKEDKTKQKFILFVGNLKYTTTKETIAQHFSLCNPPPTIRLLTPKANPGTTQHKLKSKGCAFLEFTHRNPLQQALKLHQSNLEGRLINVELTAGGGGKSESRLTKVRERNKALLGQREKRTTKEGENETSLANPQRFSTTSGSLQKPTVKKTWTVGDGDDGLTHRGGEKLRKRSKSRQKSWGTGVNAIPL